MGAAELQSLFQECSKRYERYQKALSDFSNQENNNNNIGGIQEQLIATRLEELVKSSNKAVMVLWENVEKFNQNEATRFFPQASTLAKKSARGALPEHAATASIAFEELTQLSRDEEGNTLEPLIQQELRSKILNLLKNYEAKLQT